MEDFNSDEHEPFDSRVAKYLSRRLNPQTGRAQAAFRSAATGPSARQPTSPHRRRWFGGAAALAAAAALAMVMVLGQRRPEQGPARVVEPSPAVVRLPPTLLDDELGKQPTPVPGEVHVEQAAVTARAQPGVVEELVRYRTLDEGIVVIDGRRPVRKLRRQWLERVTWIDEASGARLVRIVPREELVYVGIPVN
ncbi:MAG TPA: hypothetical protein VND64_28510 [Pirellulales bacterium]|nr:hypothetical protein [Pirellulales bacterium]